MLRGLRVLCFGVRVSVHAKPQSDTINPKSRVDCLWECGACDYHSFGFRARLQSRISLDVDDWV